VEINMPAARDSTNAHARALYLFALHAFALWGVMDIASRLLKADWPI